MTYTLAAYTLIETLTMFKAKLMLDGYEWRELTHIAINPEEVMK